MTKLTRAADLRPSSFNESDNTIEVVWTSGATVRRRDYRRDVVYDEVLSMDPGHVRLDRLNAGAPLLDTHNDSKLAAIIGSVVPGSARIAHGQGIARVKLSAAASDADLVEKIRDGIIRNISVGYAIHKYNVEAGADGLDEVRRVVDWEPLELSAVPVPADAGAQFRSHEVDDVDAIRARMEERQMAAGTPRKLTDAEHLAAGRLLWLVPNEERI
jgi:hypothetical protein